MKCPKKCSMKLTTICRTTIATAVALASLAALAVPSADAASSRRVRNACSSDAKRLCPREKPDSPEMHYCMEAKGRMLSRSCVRALEDEGIVPRGYFKN